MARVTGKYNVDFERGDGGLKSVFGTFIGNRLKENKEQYAREIKAADPTYEGKQLTALRKERADLLKELRGGGSSASGGSKRDSWTSGAKDAAEQQLKLKSEKLKAQNTYMQGVESGGMPESQIIALRDVGPNAANLESDLKNILVATTKGMGFPAKMNAGKHGIGEGILNAMKSVDGMPQSTIDQAKSFLRASGYEASKEAQAIYEDPDLITTQEQNLINIIKKGGSGGSTTTKLGAGLDPNTRNALLIKQLEQINAEIQKQQGVYSTAKSDYLDLVANPGRNFALSPTSSRPSVLSESMDMYADVYEADPRYAKEMLDKSSEAGRITVPDRFEGLKSLDGFGGKSPIDILMDTSSTLAILRGTTDKEGAVKRTLTSDDAKLVRGSLERMSRAMKSPMFNEQKYGDVKGPGGKPIPIGKFLDYITGQFDSIPEDQKAEYAQLASDTVIEWSKTQDEKKLKAARRDYNPNAAVSQSIGRIQTAKKEFDKTGDPKVLRDTMAVEHNSFINTDREIRGAGGDAFLQRLDDFRSVSSDKRNMDFLSNDLQDLSDLMITNQDTGVKNG
jgi:hypothetical protein